MEDEERLDQLESIATLLQNYVPTQDRTYDGQLYPSCFVAKEAVDLLMKNGEVETRSEAIDCLQSLMSRGLNNSVVFEHVSNSMRGGVFQDDDQCYHFVKKEDASTNTDVDQNCYRESSSSSSNSSNNIVENEVMDKYGFLIEDKKRYKEIERTREEADDSSISIEQWQGLCDKAAASKGSKLPSKLCDKIKRSTRKRLPDSIRQRAWTIFTGVEQIMTRSKGEYELLLQQADFEWNRWVQQSSGENGANSVGEMSGLTADDHDEDSHLDGSKSHRPCHVVLDQIDRDISRTFPNHYLFQTLKNEKEIGGENIGRDKVQNGIKQSNSEGENSVKSRGKSSKLTNVNSIPVAKIDGSKDIGGVDDDCNSTITPSSSKLSERGHGKGALRRVLRAYSQYDCDVGYCQGMNFIVAMFLTFLSEEESFWLLVVVMNDDRYKLRALFGEDMSGTHEILYIADKLMKKFVPKLWKHMEKEGVHNSMFVTQWLLTLYTSSFPFDLVSRVWDSFLVEGWKVIYRTMLGLLKHAEPTLLGMTFEQILMYLRDLPTMIDGQTIMRQSLQIRLKRKHVKKYLKAWKSANPTQASASRTDTNSSWANTTNSKKSNGSSRKKLGKIPIPNKFRKKVKDTEIEVENLAPQLLPIVGSAKFAILIHNALTPEECQLMIQRAEKGGFEDATIHDRRTNKTHRKCQRWSEDNTTLSQDLYRRILTALDDSGFEYKIRNAPWMGRRYDATALPIQSVGLNERLRVLKYSSGDYFGSHCDTQFVRGSNQGGKTGDTSHVSVHVYLNEKFKGGQTRFHGGGRYYDVVPKTGSILVFDHNLLHQGAVVKGGKKYIVRTDVMYRPVKGRGS